MHKPYTSSRRHCNVHLSMNLTVAAAMRPWTCLVQEQQHQDAVAALCAQHASALEAAAAKSAQEVAEHAESLEQQRQQLLAAMRSTDRAAQQDQQQQQAEFESELSSMRQLHEQSLTELQGQHEAELSKLQRELTQAHQEELASELEALSQQHEQEVTQQLQLREVAVGDSARALDDLKAEYEQGHSLVTQRLLHEIQQLGEEQSHAEAKLTQGYTEQLDLLQETLRLQHQDAMTQLQHASEACMADRQQAHDDEVQNLKGQLQDLQEQLQTDEAGHQARMEAVLQVHQVCFLHRQ